MTPLAGPQTAYSARFHWVFPQKNGVLLFNKPHGEQWKSTQSGRFPRSCGAESEATRFCRCLRDVSSSYGSLRNNDPSQRSNHNNRVGRCRWWCASSGKPCDIVGCVGGFQSCQIRRVSAVDACVIPSVRMRPASEHIGGRISELCHILGGGMPTPAGVVVEIKT